MKLTKLATATVLACATLPAAADEALEAAMQTYLDTSVRQWANDPVLLDAVRSQNARTAGLTQAEILVLDETWRAEVGNSATPTISPVLDNAAAAFLRSVVEEAGGTITEVFVMDAVGLNVAASDVTSDYWQGDEDKHSATFGTGGAATHFGEIEFDESTQSYQSQISLTLIDPATGRPIGAITVGVNADALF